MKNQASWLSQPSKKQTIMVTLLWAFGILCSLLAETNFFTENLFQSKNSVLNSLHIAATIITITVIKNYFANMKKGAKPTATIKFILRPLGLVLAVGFMLFGALK